MTPGAATTGGERRGRITEASIDAVLQRADIVDLVSGYTQLKKAGAEFTGRCPFHEERTPSFWVNSAKGVYHCFGCAASGNIIGFLRDKQGLDFVEAVEYLADRYRVTLEYEGAGGAPSGPRVDKPRVYALLETATSFYEAYLWKSGEAAPARAYLRERGVTEETARAFRMGYSPEGSTATAPRARAKGFTVDELRSAGLIGQKGGDFFRGRLMVPIIDRANRVIAFGARKLRDEQYGGKYVNSPDGPVFRKSRGLFTPPGIREAAQAAGCAVVVEGYMDVIAMHQAGMGNGVAAMGTSLTEEQVTELKRLAPKAFFAFDPDAAGQMAALRALAKAREQDLDVRVTLLNDGDPADVLALPDGAATLQEALDHSVTLLHYRVSALLGAADLSDGPGRDRAYEDAAKLFAELPPGVERSEQVQRVAGVLRLSPDLVARLEGGVRGTATAAAIASERRGAHQRGVHTAGEQVAIPRLMVRAEASPEAQAELRLLAQAAHAVEQPGSTWSPAASGVREEWFSLEAHRRTWQALASGRPDPLGPAAIKDDPELLAVSSELGAMRARMLSHAEAAADPAELLRELAGRVELLFLDRELSAVRAQIGAGNEEDGLVERFLELKNRRAALLPRVDGLRSE